MSGSIGPKTLVGCAVALIVGMTSPLLGQLIDKTQAPNTANEGISRPLLSGALSEIGDGRSGTDMNTSVNVIAYDPFRAIRRGRQLFQRKFSRIDGQGPLTGDGAGDVNTTLAIGAV